MPGGNRTGPMGMGPRTGRAAGYCAGSETPGYAGQTPGRGFGGGRGGFGGGRGRRNMSNAADLPGRGRFGAGGMRSSSAYAKPDPEMERRTLRSQAEALKAEIDNINKRLRELENE